MKSLILFSLLISVVFTYEYYTFTQEVPGSVCKFQKCNPTMMGDLGLNTMNMHGLWPDTADASKRPADCQANLYDESKLDADLKAKMDAVWVGLYNNTFWFRWHEWGKHGTCWVDASSEKKTFLQADDYFTTMNHFFQKVIDVKAKVNLDSLLYTDGEAEKTFKFDDLNAAILNHIGVEKYYIHCQTKSSVQYLDVIEICLDLSYNYVDCPEYTNNCKTTEDVVVPQISSKDFETE